MLDKTQEQILLAILEQAKGRGDTLMVPIIEGIIGEVTLLTCSVTGVQATWPINPEGGLEIGRIYRDITPTPESERFQSQAIPEEVDKLLGTRGLTVLGTTKPIKYKVMELLGAGKRITSEALMTRIGCPLNSLHSAIRTLRNEGNNIDYSIGKGYLLIAEGVVATSYKPKQSKPNPKYWAVVAMLADQAPIKQIEEECQLSLGVIMNVARHQKPYIEELQAIEPGQGRYDYLQKHYGVGKSV